jgi:hypothetical protein
MPMLLLIERFQNILYRALTVGAHRANGRIGLLIVLMTYPGDNVPWFLKLQNSLLLIIQRHTRLLMCSWRD